MKLERNHIIGLGILVVVLLLFANFSPLSSWLMEKPTPIEFEQDSDGTITYEVKVIFDLGMRAPYNCDYRLVFYEDGVESFRGESLLVSNADEEYIYEYTYIDVVFPTDTIGTVSYTTTFWVLPETCPFPYVPGSYGKDYHWDGPMACNRYDGIWDTYTTVVEVVPAPTPTPTPTPTAAPSGGGGGGGGSVPASPPEEEDVTEAVISLTNQGVTDTDISNMIETNKRVLIAFIILIIILLALYRDGKK